MTDQDRQHAERIGDWFTREMRAKYARGVVEHGGHLPDKGGLLAEAEAECLDLPVYVRTLRAQLARVLAALDRGEVAAATASLRMIVDGSIDERLTV